MLICLISLQNRTWADFELLNDVDFIKEVSKLPTIDGPNENGDVIRRVPHDVIVISGTISNSRAKAMTLALAHTKNIPVPNVRRVVRDTSRGGIVPAMDYIPGPTLKECWDKLSVWQRLSVVLTLRRYVHQPRRVDISKHAQLYPGPLADEPAELNGRFFPIIAS